MKRGGVHQDFYEKKLGEISSLSWRAHLSTRFFQQRAQLYGKV
jgi:hypothetical protein